MEIHENPGAIETEGFDCHVAVRKLNNSAFTGLKIIISDCCRNETKEITKSFTWNVNYDPNVHKPDLEKGCDKTESNESNTLKNTIQLCACTSGQSSKAPDNSDEMSHFTSALVSSISELSSTNANICSVKDAIVKKLSSRVQTVASIEWDLCSAHAIIFS